MLGLLITLLIWGLILALVWWVVTMIPVPPPFVWVIRVVFAIVCIIVLIEILAGGLGGFGGLHLGRGCP